MTVKEIAKFTGKTDRAVRNWISKAAKKSSSVEEKKSSAGHGKVFKSIAMELFQQKVTI